MRLPDKVTLTYNQRIKSLTVMDQGFDVTFKISK